MQTRVSAGICRPIARILSHQSTRITTTPDRPFVLVWPKWTEATITDGHWLLLVRGSSNRARDPPNSHHSSHSLSILAPNWTGLELPSLQPSPVPRRSFVLLLFHPFHRRLQAQAAWYPQLKEGRPKRDPL